MTLPQMLWVGGLCLAGNVVVFLAARRLVWGLTDAVNDRLARLVRADIYLADAIREIQPRQSRPKVVPLHRGPGPTKDGH